MVNKENARVIWQVLRANGATEAGAAGCLGNIAGESSYISYRVQGDMKPQNGYAYSKEYTNQVDSGEITKTTFCHDGPGGGGYGLCQWTYWSRKSDLYDYLKAQNLSIGDLVGQAKYLVKDLRDHYPVVWNIVTTTNDIREAMYEVLTEYERPTDQWKDAQDKRYNLGKECFDEFSGMKVEENPEYIVDEEFYVLSSGANSSDVYRLQAALLKKGYNPNGVDGIFGNGTEKAVRKYQKEHGYIVNGLVDEKLFNEILDIVNTKPIETPEEVKPEISKDNSIMVKTIQKGSKGPIVKNMQVLLNSKGYSVGSADGDFGNNTLSGLKRFQKAKNLEQNGICDASTWSFLINE